MNFSRVSGFTLLLFFVGSCCSFLLVFRVMFSVLFDFVLCLCVSVSNVTVSLCLMFLCLCVWCFCVLCLMFLCLWICPFVNAPSVFTSLTFRRIHLRCCDESWWWCIFCIMNRNTAMSGYNTVQLTWPKQKRPSFNIH